MSHYSPDPNHMVRRGNCWVPLGWERLEGRVFTAVWMVGPFALLLFFFLTR